MFKYSYSVIILCTQIYEIKLLDTIVKACHLLFLFKYLAGFYYKTIISLKIVIDSVNPQKYILISIHFDFL